ncbi:hybrid sensor histidine kinase/response regulator [Giesbergeria anulus]|uniref:Chemotaxis protein CheA n=1 Tax=Giesbergeria anulus TaxID=180197 RepID=A0A1H9F1S5_9BURK|nr:hybrid sensor histidine kinase/response regulator [Giesbergeria anulus]SEQ31198.1 two-component system, chemotaxis family, sensor kinase CheA [Giesbergeria anulus]
MAIDIRKFITRFVEEARDHIRQLSEGIAQLGNGGASHDTINALFRSAHTIKGSARMLKLLPITETAFQVEEVLGKLRDTSLTYTPTLGPLLQQAIDQLATLVDVLAGTGDPGSLPAVDAALVAALMQASTGVGPATTTPQPTASTDNAEQSAPPAPTPAPAAVEPRLSTTDTVRVRLTKLDELIKLMGEVVSSHVRLQQRQADLRALEHAAAQHDAGLAQQLRRFAQALRDDVQSQAMLINELHDKTLAMRMLPLAIVFEPAAHLVRDLGRSVGKQIDCTVRGADIELDRQMIDQLTDPFIHLIRNAVDHGIEPPELRAARGKPTVGTLTLSACQDGNWVLLEVSDDGGGIALDQVRDKAIKKGFITPEKAAALSDRGLIDLIFLPGLSTNHIITDLSGRGVGMDVVKECVLNELHGIISVDTRAGVGTTFSLRLPLSLAMMRMLLVEVQGLPFAINAQYVGELLRLPTEALMLVAGRQAVIIRNEFVPVVRLAELLAIPPKRTPSPRQGSTTDANLLMLVLRVDNQALAVCVDALLDEHDMVIKALPAHLKHLPLLSGMVLTGHNELASVLHAPALLDAARQARGESVRAEATHHQGDVSTYHVLVVDDSLNTREIERDVLQAYGYQVTLAEDGLDGLNKALANDFDAVLTDVEMPHMDGFTLTARLRQETKYQTKPIIIITSREKDEDKRRGIQVGADAYIVKGDFDRSNLVDTLKSLLG